MEKSIYSVKFQRLCAVLRELRQEAELQVAAELGVTLLCRLWGTRVTWRVGFRSPPPQAHAWVEAGGEPVREPWAPT
ncbi:MAG: lasso peptide biosynthesis B2 protein [Pseudonocardiaceae bacterium]